MEGSRKLCQSVFETTSLDQEMYILSQITFEKFFGWLGDKISKNVQKDN